MSEIVLCRVDSRLIHGQVVTKWLQQSGANEIFVVSDELEQDEFLKSIYLMAAPPGVEVKTYGVKSAIDYWQNEAAQVNSKVLFLVPDLTTIEAMVGAGIITKDIQVGGLGGGPDRKNILKNINLSADDVASLERMLVKEMNIFFQAIPEDAPIEMSKLIEKFKSL